MATPDTSSQNEPSAEGCSIVDGLWSQVRFWYHLLFSLHHTQDIPIPRRVYPGLLLLTGLITGLVACGVFAITWRMFGDIYFSESSRLRLIPSIAVLILLVCTFHARSLIAFSATVEQLFGLPTVEHDNLSCSPAVLRPSSLAVAAVVLLLLLKFSCLLSLPFHAQWVPLDWRRYVMFLHPRSFFRVLLLWPVWGMLAVIIACGTGRHRDTNPPALRILSGCLRPWRVMVYVAIVVLITSLYFSPSQQPGIGLVVAMISFAIITVVSLGVSSRIGGHNIMSIIALGEVGQLAFMLTYQALARWVP